jgi:hypothetical protein
MQHDDDSATSLRKLEKYIGTLKPSRELNVLPLESREVILSMNNHISNARMLVFDSLTAANSQVQLVSLKAGIKHLQELDEDIVTASQLDLLGPADVAHLSAMTQQLVEGLSGREDNEQEDSTRIIDR